MFDTVYFDLVKAGEIGSKFSVKIKNTFSIEEIAAGVLDTELVKILQKHPDFENGFWNAGFSNCGFGLNGLATKSLEEFLQDFATKKNLEVIKKTQSDLQDYRFTNDKVLGQTNYFQYGLLFFRNSNGEKITLHSVQELDGERDYFALTLKGLKDVVCADYYTDCCEISAISRGVNQSR